LARLRNAAGLSQAQLAATLGVSSGRVVRGWESGRFAPRVDQLPGLARALGVPVETVVAAIVGPGASTLRSAQGTRPPGADPVRAIQFHLREVERLARQLADGDGGSASASAPRRADVGVEEDSEPANAEARLPNGEG
jgi:transcriptional regulator with XRE-family HTH domain